MRETAIAKQMQQSQRKEEMPKNLWMVLRQFSLDTDFGFVTHHEIKLLKRFDKQATRQILLLIFCYYKSNYEVKINDISKIERFFNTKQVAEKALF